MRKKQEEIEMRTENPERIQKIPHGRIDRQSSRSARKRNSMEYRVSETERNRESARKEETFCEKE